MLIDRALGEFVLSHEALAIRKSQRTVNRVAMPSEHGVASTVGLAGSPRPRTVERLQHRLLGAVGAEHRDHGYQAVHIGQQRDGGMILD